MYIGEASHVNSIHVTKMEALRPIVLCRNFPLKMQTRSATTLKTLQRVRQQRGGRAGGQGAQKRLIPFRQPPKLKPSEVNPSADAASVFQAARAYDPYLIPVPIRMGRPGPGDLPPVALGNVELLKISNFFHLTPAAIDKHCAALKPLCSPWPDTLPPLDMRVVTRNYVFPAPSLRHPGSKKVKVMVDLSRVRFRDDKAREKMILLAGRRYDASSNMLTLVGNRCPTRKQNKDYLIYLIKVLYLESHRTEAWEMDDQ